MGWNPFKSEDAAFRWLGVVFVIAVVVVVAVVIARAV